MENKDNCKHKKAPTSYHMQNPDIIFKELGLKQGDVFLDIGCGAGDYVIHASKIVGNSGKVYALDRQEDSISIFKEKIRELGIINIESNTSDITKKLPIKDKSIDICFIATVLHGLDFEKHKEHIFKEIKRILKPSGRLAIIECSKKDLSYGPPEQMRLDAEQIEESAVKFGFRKVGFTDLGFNYLIQFQIKIE
ncbi:MAG: methyltransferase domain-containing protein [Nanoarchaeota archaeon]|nr:methyltransferase domain-containing protein [Nanoarchaeota archaeon]